MSERVLYKNNNPIIYITAALVSILISIAALMRATVINPDGICYLQSAATLSVADLHTAMQVCGQAHWPFYSMVIFAVTWVTHLSFYASAFSLNSLFSLISVMAFVYITHLLGGTRRVLWMAAAVILFAHEFNSVREYVIRDHGYWAFYLVSIIFLLRFLREKTVYFAVLWSISIFVAALFRIEGLLFLGFVPFVVWLQPEPFSLRAKAFLQLNLLSLIGVGILLSGFHIPLERISELQFQFSHGVHALTNNFQHAALVLKTQILSIYAARDADLILLLLLVMWFVWSVVSNLSVIYTFLLGYAVFNKLLQLDKAARYTLLSYVLINVIIAALFLAEFFFLSKRYLLGLTLVFMFWVPFALDRLWQMRYEKKYLLGAVLALLVINSLGGIYDFGYSKKYIKNAGNWLASNVPNQAKIYSNDEQVMYYSNHFGNDIFAKSKKFADLNTLHNLQWKEFDYLAIRITKPTAGDTRILQQIPFTPMQVFQNKRGDKVLIYKIQES